MKAPAIPAALVLIDMQQGMTWPTLPPRNNPDAEANIAALLAAWRAAAAPVVHVRHASSTPGSTFWPGQPGADFQPGFLPQPSELVVEKSVPDAFSEPALAAWLRARDVDAVVLVGVSTNNSVESTARAGGNAGWRVTVVSDATFTFDKADFRGVHRSADEVHAMSLANLDGEYALVVLTAALLALPGL